MIRHTLKLLLTLSLSASLALGQVPIKNPKLTGTLDVAGVSNKSTAVSALSSRLGVLDANAGTLSLSGITLTMPTLDSLNLANNPADAKQTILSITKANATGMTPVVSVTASNSSFLGKLQDWNFNGSQVAYVDRTGMFSGDGSGLTFATTTNLQSAVSANAVAFRNAQGASSGVWPISAGGTGKAALPVVRAVGDGSGHVAMTASTWMDLLFWSEQEDGANQFTGGVFTAAVTGYYDISARVPHDATGANTLTFGVWRSTNGGSSYSEYDRLSNNTQSLYSGGTSTLILSSGDKIKLRAIIGTSGVTVYADTLISRLFIGLRAN